MIVECALGVLYKVVYLLFGYKNRHYISEIERVIKYQAVLELNLETQVVTLPSLEDLMDAMRITSRMEF
jgi:7-cyano-7-deazaguanine synthase in queuosine biosynthesis